MERETHKDRQVQREGRLRWFSERIVGIFNHQTNPFRFNYISVMALLIGQWPIINLFLCNYACVSVCDRKCVSQRCLASCLCAVRERLKEWSIKLPRSWSFIECAPCFSHHFWAHWRRRPPRLHSRKVGPTRVSDASSRFDYREAALLNNGQVGSAHLRNPIVNSFKNLCICDPTVSLRCLQIGYFLPFRGNREHFIEDIFVRPVLKRQYHMLPK